MAHSYIDFRGNSQLMHDIEVVTVVSVVCDIVKTRRSSLQLTKGIDAMIASWCGGTNVYAPGCFDLEFDTYIRTEADRQCMLQLLDVARDELLRFGKVVPGEYLNRVADAPGILELTDRPVADLIASQNKLSELLKNTEPLQIS